MSKISNSLSSNIFALFNMWARPRLVAWFLVLTAVGVLVRLPFMGLQILPGYMDFNPGIILIPLGGIFFGPAGFWSALVASVLGDKLLGQWSALSYFRAAGFALFALCSQKLWDFTFHPKAGPASLDATWGRTLRFIFITWPGCLLASSWQAIGSELLRLYPFTYVASLLILNNVLFCTLLGLPLYRILAREWIPHFGDWRDALRDKECNGTTSWLNALLIFVGCVGAILSGLIASEVFYDMTPLQPFVIGSHSGPLVRAWVLPFMLVQLVGLLKK